jgi:hypothetical protein
VIGRTRLAAGWFVSAMMILIAACGGGSATTAPTATPAAAASQAASSPAAVASLPTVTGGGGLPGALDAGTIVTADMAASIIGGSPTKVVIPGLGGPGMGLVAYSTATGDTVTVLVEQVPGGIANAGLQAAIQAAGAQGSLTSISGLGDAAGKVVATYEATVAFVKGSNLVVIVASSSTTAGTDLEPKVEAVARQVAGKI